MSVTDFASSFQSNPLYAIVAAFVAGLITSLGPCTFSRAIVLIGHIAREKNVSRNRGFFISFIFLIGLLIAYVLYGLFGYLAKNVNLISTNIFYLAGVIAVLMGLHFAEIIKMRLPLSSTKLLKARNIYSKYQGTGGGLIMGFSFGLMLCPCCLPGLLFIISFTFIQGNFIYGLLLLFVYVIGHGLPLLGIGTFSGAITGLKSVQKYSVYVNLIVGILIFIIGLLFLWTV